MHEDYVVDTCMLSTIRQHPEELGVTEQFVVLLEWLRVIVES